MRVKEDSYRKKMILGQDGNALVQLIAINAFIFLILKFIWVVYSSVDSLKAGGGYTSHILNWFILPASSETLSSRPWTALTYFFSEARLSWFIGNMFWLWGFGYILQDLTGNRKLAPIYIYGGLAGAAIFILSYAVLPGLHGHASQAWFMGAGPAIIAVAIATTTVAPDYRIFPMINGGIPLWILTVLFLLINFSSLPYGDSPVYLANLAGAGAGFFFIYRMRRGHDGSIWMNQLFDWVNNLFNPDREQNGRQPKDEFYYKVSGTQPFKKIPHVTQQRIDEILDKINQQGYRFLTDEEKEILKRAADEEDL